MLSKYLKAIQIGKLFLDVADLDNLNTVEDLRSRVASALKLAELLGVDKALLDKASPYLLNDLFLQLLLSLILKAKARASGVATTQAVDLDAILRFVEMVITLLRALKKN